MERRAITGFGVALLAILGLAIFFLLNFHTVIVSGTSMIPTLKDRQKVLVSKAYWLVGNIQAKDIVVVKEKNGSGYFIKRVYRLPGQQVDYANYPKSYKIADGPFVVPQGTFFVLGDNRSHSEDSRQFGPVEQDRVIGKVIVAR